MLKVFLTNPPLNMAETPLQYHRPLVPMGLAYLGAMIEDRFGGGEWSNYVRRRALHGTGRYRPSGVVAAQDNMFLSFYGRFTYEGLRDRIAAHFAGAGSDETFIGMSILSDGMHGARHVLRRLRTDFPTTTFLAGGPHATFFPHDFYEQPGERIGPLVDYVVRNEGEHAILGIIDGLLFDADRLRENGPSLGIDPARCDFGSQYRVIDGGQYRGAGAGIGRHVLDSLPPPAYFLFEDGAGRLPYEPDDRYGLRAPAANINSSRGCPHSCTFCTIPTLAPGYRTLSPERMIELMRFLNGRYDIESVFFREDNFMYEGGRLEGSRWSDIEELCAALKATLPGMRWAIEARADNLLASASGGRSRIELMADAGLCGIYVGVESGSDAVLKVYGKGASVATMSDAIRACTARSVAVVATACYGDADIFFRHEHARIDLHDARYASQLAAERERVLAATRWFMDRHDIPAERREEYALVGIPVSAAYRLLQRDHVTYPGLVEHTDPVSRYIYPKGFRWWANRVYELKRRVRPLTSFTYQPAINAI